MTQVDVVIATPSLSLQICFEGAISRLLADRLLIAKGITADHIALGYDPYLAKVRSKLATMFLEDYPNATDLFFIDDDVSFPPQKVVELLERPQDIVAGTYPKKCDVLQFPISLLADKPGGSLMKSDGLVRASMVPTGFMRIKRHVVEAVAEKAETFWDIDYSFAPRRYREIFQMGRRGEVWVGEDVAFCHQCASLGFEIWADPNCPMTHRGSKTWAANLADHMHAFEAKAAGA